MFSFQEILYDAWTLDASLKENCEHFEVKCFNTDYISVKLDQDLTSTLCYCKQLETLTVLMSDKENRIKNNIY